MTETHVLPTGTPSELKLAVEAAVDLLRRGEVVGLPTETVYGLGADATNDRAVARIFDVKDRPRFDPLIVHLPAREYLTRYVELADMRDEQLLARLRNAFWPGPLTILFPRPEELGFLVTSGLATVAIRLSAHPVFAAIAQELGRPVAAPSANRFGKTSPTSAAHVQAELGGRIPLIVDAGPSAHGIESTVIALNGGRIEVLRHGPITVEQLEEFGPVSEADDTVVPRSPGQLSSHYAPATPLHLVEDLDRYSCPAGKKIGALAWHNRHLPSFAEVLWLSRTGNLREAAANLFSHLRALDASGVDIIVAETVPETGLGRAIMDRLRRAASEVSCVP